MYLYHYNYDNIAEIEKEVTLEFAGLIKQGEIFSIK
jgi:hypothetical protein